jgi:uncharacterized membrane-anchored protein YitT (DUF2179 family)
MFSVEVRSGPYRPLGSVDGPCYSLVIYPAFLFQILTNFILLNHGWLVVEGRLSVIYLIVERNGVHMRTGFLSLQLTIFPHILQRSDSMHLSQPFQSYTFSEMRSIILGALLGGPLR